MTRDPSVCGIVAAYNARDTIAGVVAGVRRSLGTVIVADDGSTDGTAEAAREAGAVVIAVGTNRGKGHALRLLFAEARRHGFSAVVAVDADGQHDVRDIPSFLQTHHQHPDAILTGSRMAEAERIPRHRRNSMLVARFFISLGANQFIADTQCGFRLYPLAAIESMSLLKEGFVTETEILIKAGDSGREIRSLAITAHYPQGQPTHFRTVPDVAAISRYVISYLMVKWAIETIRPGTVHSYRGPGTSRDAFCPFPCVDSVFEWLMVFSALPLSTLYASWHVLAPRLSVSAVASLKASGLPAMSLLGSVLLLPVLLGISIVELLGNRLGLRLDLTSPFIRRRYAQPWRQAAPDSAPEAG